MSKEFPKKFIQMPVGESSVARDRREVIVVYLIRHGQTDWNLFRRANGITDTFLNMTGLGQAKQLAEELKMLSLMPVSVALKQGHINSVKLYIKVRLCSMKGSLKLSVENLRVWKKPRK